MSRAGVIQTEQVAEWSRAIHELDERGAALVEGLSDKQLNWSPPDGGWSVAQVFAHLATTNELYLKQIRGAISRANSAGLARELGEWRPTVAGRMLASVFRSSRRAPAPRAFQPAAEPLSRAESVDAFLRTQRELLVELNRAASMDLRKARTHSPVIRIIPLNLGDCFELLVLHTRRHLGQVERVMARATGQGNRAPSS